VQYVSVGDLILDKLPTYNLSLLFDFGIFWMPILVFVYAVFAEPEVAPFALKTYGLLYLVRVCFMVLTHVGPPVGFFYQDLFVSGSDPLKVLTFRNDLFFSGHTAIPFLAYFLFKKYRIGRIIMLLMSLLMGLTVLLMHVHYSIDVFAAFFITYGVYSLSNEIFNKLNVRFKRILDLHGWASFQKKMLGQGKKKAKLKK
jgi:membrane-associated phospholipid phosphatase